MRRCNAPAACDATLGLEAKTGPRHTQALADQSTGPRASSHKGAATESSRWVARRRSIRGVMEKVAWISASSSRSVPLQPRTVRTAWCPGGAPQQSLKSFQIREIKPIDARTSSSGSLQRFSMQTLRWAPRKHWHTLLGSAREPNCSHSGRRNPSSERRCGTPFEE